MLRSLLLPGLLLLTGLSCSGYQSPDDATGTLRVITHTTGDTPDPDGYTLTVTGHGTVAIGLNDTITYANIPIDDYTVTLGDVAGSCTVTDGAVRASYVGIGILTIQFFVPCP